LIGFESVSRASLTCFNKPFNNPDEYENLIEALHAHGIAVNGTFVFGNDPDDTSAFDAVRDFVLKTRIDLPRFSILTPFPGTALFKRLEQEGRILHRDWSQYDGQHVVFEPKKMSPAELLAGHERIWRDVYSYRSILHRTRLQLENLPLMLAANIAYRFYAHNLERFYNCTAGVV
jgi:radical SAM superfamily enzyme YgiQ (UPF0313 family)